MSIDDKNRLVVVDAGEYPGKKSIEYMQITYFPADENEDNGSVTLELNDGVCISFGAEEFEEVLKFAKENSEQM